MRSLDGYTYSNVSTTQGPFILIGGQYAFDVVATWGGGSVKLQRLGPDTTTWLDASAALTSNNEVLVTLPPGSYQIVIVTATAVYARVTRIPGE